MKKDLCAMTPNEVAAQMLEWFPFLTKKIPRQALALSKEEKESRVQWGDIQADMQAWVDYHAERRSRGLE